MDKKITVIKFSASWCHPCKALAPEFKKITEEYADKIKVKEIDVDDDEEGLTDKYHIRSVPTVLLIDNETDTVLSTITGNVPSEIRQQLSLRLK